ncbi:unnamed protein product [Absidia cylindrospora]
MQTTLFSYLLLIFCLATQVAHGLSTHKEAQIYLMRYSIPHDELDDAKLLETVKRYRDLAVLNTELFGDRVERLLEGLDKKLEHYYKVAEPHQRQRLLKDIERELRQLEVQGQMTRDHVHEQLTDVNNKVAVSSSHFLTPEQWRQVIRDVEETVTPPSTWSTWFGKSTNSIVRIGDKDPYQTWLDDTSTPFASWLTISEHRTLKTALDKAMKRQELGSKDWWRQLIKELHGFSADRVERVMEELRIHVLGFKIFAHDYLGLPTPPPVYQDEHSWAERSDYYVVNLVRTWTHNVARWLQGIRQHLDQQASSFIAEKKEQSQQLHNDWAKAIQQAKESFATYWHKREYDAYRRIGYTEGEIDWIRGYLEKALHHSSPTGFNQIILDVRQYLNSLERQTKAQVELHVLKLDRMLQAWKLSVLGPNHHSEF